MLDEVFEKTKNFHSLSEARALPKIRYFIELHVPSGHEDSRALMDEMRRHKAFEFISIVGEWFKDNDVKDEVSSLSVTAMGQVMIVCTHKVIDLIRAQDIWGIAHIRAADQTSDLRRISGRV